MGADGMQLIEGHRPIDAPPGAHVVDVDPYDPIVLTDPLDYFATLRGCDVAYIPRYSVLAVARHEHVNAVFSDHDRFVSSRGVGLNDFKLEKPWRPPSIILEADPPDHTRTRRVLARVLSQKAVRDFAELFRTTAETLVDDLIKRSEIEAVTEFAEVFPTTVFPRALGMHDINPRHLVDYGAMVFNAVGPDNAIRRKSMAQADVIVPWITTACARDRLTEDGLGAAIYADADRGEITYAEAGMLVRSLLSAGVDTTVTGIGSALWCFAQNPGEWEKVRADPTLVRPAIDEVLRYTFPVHTFARTAGCDAEIAGVPIVEGAKILCVIGAANRDPDKWHDADAFRVDRRPRGHLAFGVGIHGCVGQNIARAEIEAVLTAMIPRVARIEPIGQAAWRPNNSIHALDRMQIRLVPH